MKKLSIESLNNLFEFLQSQSEAVLWIRSRGYERQLYLSPNFEALWGQNGDILYKDPRFFENFLLPEDRNVYREICQQDELGSVRVSYLYRIKDKQGTIKHIKDWHYLLTDDQDFIIGVAGIAQFIPQSQWEDEQIKLQKPLHSDDPIQILQKHIFAILKNELHINSQSISENSPKLAFPFIKNKKGRSVDLTSRESECLTYLLKGKSAKQTASILNISQRTVEFHLDNIKEKAGCRTKLEVLGQIKSS